MYTDTHLTFKNIVELVFGLFAVLSILFGLFALFTPTGTYYGAIIIAIACATYYVLKELRAIRDSVDRLGEPPIRKSIYDE